jgi:hypothetical protein
MANTHISSNVKLAVTHQVNLFIETYLKPNFIEPPPENNDFNYSTLADKIRQIKLDIIGQTSKPIA